MSAVEAFRKCPTEGCSIHVWGPVGTDNYCRAHGGNRFDFPEVDDDEYGIPRANAGGPPPPPVLRPLETA